MANEITITATININKAPISITGGGRAKQITQSGDGNQGITQAIATTTEQLTFTDVDDIGYLYVENLDSTNFVLLGLSNPVSAANCFAKLRAGEFCLIPTIQETIYAIADTASCNVFHVAAEL